MTITTNTKNDRRYHADALETLATDLLTRVGLDLEKSRVVAKTLIEADLLGHDTHGLALLPRYLKEIETGSMSTDEHYEVLSDKPAVQVWDGKRLPGPWLVEKGLDALMPRARDYGVASLAIRRSHHIACLAVYLMRAAREGFMMVLASSDSNSASVAPFGGTQAVFTPNPIAIGYPCSHGDVLIDISASITTNGLTSRKARHGEVFDEDWLLDAQGNLTNDPRVLSQNPPGTILPIGGVSYGHKGYGLSLMIEALTGGLSGWGRADPKVGWGAIVHITLYDIDSFGGREDFLRQMDHVAQACLSNPTRPGVTAVRLPGHKGQQMRQQQLERGVLIHADIPGLLAEFCDKLHCPFPLPIQSR